MAGSIKSPPNGPGTANRAAALAALAALGLGYRVWVRPREAGLSLQGRSLLFRRFSPSHALGAPFWWLDKRQSFSWDFATPGQSHAGRRELARLRRRLLRRPARPPRGRPADRRVRPPPGARAARRGARERPSAPSREPTCRAGTRSSPAPGRGRETARPPPVHAARQGRDQGDQGGGDRGASAHVGPVATHARTRGRMGSLGPRRDGGTGRRAGLKIPWASAREGSTPSPGTQTTRPSTTRSPRSNRSSPSDEMSTVRASPSTTSSAMSLPTTGACWNP